MTDIVIGKGQLAGKGIYANKNFKKGDVVIKYTLKSISKEKYDNLSKSEKRFTHIQWGTIYLYAEPERYVNNSKKPNTYQDHTMQADVALTDIKKGEMITTDASKDDIS